MDREAPERVLYADDVFQIQGAIFEVNQAMGTGFLEAVYQECLAIEFAAREIPFVAFPQLGLIIVELKAARELAPEHRAQVLNYLKATGLRLGLLVNFGGASKARIERLVL
jgi:hypothetical protein